MTAPATIRMTPPPQRSAASVTVIVPTAGRRGFVDGADRVALPYTVRRVRDDLGAAASVTLLVAPGTPVGALHQAQRTLAETACIRPTTDDPWSADAVNRAVLAASTPHVVLLGDDVTAASAQSWTGLLGCLNDPETMLVGPRLLRWDGRVAAAGLSVTAGRLRPVGHGERADQSAARGLPRATGIPDGSATKRRRAASGRSGGRGGHVAVTALPVDCLAFSRSAFLSVGGLCVGMTARAGAVDLCLKVAAEFGPTVVAVGSDFTVGRGARLPTPAELIPVRERWGHQLSFDRYAPVA